MKTITGKTAAIALGIICIFLTIILIVSVSNYSLLIKEKDTSIEIKDTTIKNLNSQISSLKATITEKDDTISSLTSQIVNQTSQNQALANQNSELQTWLNGNISDFNAQIGALQNQTTTLMSQIETLQDNASSLNSQISILQNQAQIDQSTINNLQSQIANTNSQVDYLSSANNNLQIKVEDLTSIINMSKIQLQTLAFHVCEKGDDFAWKLPNVAETYEQIAALNNGTYEILLLPEYKSHLNWTEELCWLAANFGGKEGIPIMLDVFTSTENSTAVTQLSIENISQAMAVCNVQYVRIFEAISWHMEHGQHFPADYVKDLLGFCKTNGLKVFWSEWKTDNLPDVKTFTDIQSYIAGYEDIVTVSFGTNSHEAQPPDGFLYLQPMFKHWGASVQAWHADTYLDCDPLDMPPYLLVQHALSAKQIGAEIIQFEPYWYFFNNGQANENLTLLLTMLK